MPLPARLRNEGEEVVVDARPTLWILTIPVLAAVLAVAIAAAGAAEHVVTPVAWALVGLVVLALVNLLARWLRWRATSLVVTTDRIVRRNGVLARSGREIPLHQLADVSYRQTIFDRLIRSGDLVFQSAGRDSTEVFPSVPHPRDIQDQIDALLHARDAPRGVAGGLSLPEQLDKLDDLRRRGVLTDAEFEASKARILDQ